MATIKKTDFDKIDEAVEQAAIEEAAAALDVKQLVKGGKFYGLMPDGRIIEVGFDLSLSDVDELQGEDALGQFKLILAKLGKDDDLEYLQNVSMITASRLAEKYFRVFERVTGAGLGE